MNANPPTPEHAAAAAVDPTTESISIFRDDDADRDPVDLLAEDFIRRQRRGETPTVEEYATKHPHLADRLRHTLPAVLMLERLKPAASDSTRTKWRELPPLTGQLGDFRIVREVGRGGMGVVYEAEQVSLGRRVALKVLPDHPRLDAMQRARFEREAKAAARLHHTNIVPVFGVGTEGGLHYYVMQFIDGRGLDALVGDLRWSQTGEISPNPAEPESPTPHPDTTAPATEPIQAGLEAQRKAGSSAPTLDPHAITWIGIQIADALHHAHAAGILHRDVKPANLMLDTSGRVWVTDFGLAKLDDQPDLTRDTDVIGTLRYMAPERFRGTCDARSDVYSLGLVLYELLTLRPAHQATTRHELVRQITSGPPVAPRRIAPRIPRDLETIVLKATAHAPADRYATAAELADDLRRHLEDRPILARRASAMERSWRWCRRNRTSAALAGCVLGLLLALTVGSVVAALRYHRLAGRESAARGEADGARRTAEATLAQLYPANAIAASRRGDDAQAALWFANAAALAPAGSDLASRHAVQTLLWTRNLHAPVAAVRLSDARIEQITLHPGARYALVRTSPEIVIWDLSQETRLKLPAPATAAAWSPDGLLLATATDRNITIHRFPDLTPLSTTPCNAPAADLAFHPNGRRLACAAGNLVRVIDLDPPAIAREFHHDSRVIDVSFSATGDRLVSTTESAQARVLDWNADPAAPTPPPVEHDAPVPPLLVNNGLTLITARKSELVWRRADSAAADDVIRTTPLAQDLLWLSSDAAGDRVLVGTREQVQVLDADTAAVLAAVPLQHPRPASGLLSPDGMTVLVTYGDPRAAAGATRGADLSSVTIRGTHRAPPLESLAGVELATFSTTGRHLATLGPGPLLRVWALPTGPLRTSVIPVAGHAPSFRFDPTGRYLMPAGLSNNYASLRATQVFDIETAAPVGPVFDPRDGSTIRSADFSPDARTASVATTSRDKHRLHLWNWRTGAPITSPIALPSTPLGVRFDPTGARVAVRCLAGHVLIVDTTSGDVFNSWEADKVEEKFVQWAVIAGLSWTPDGQSLVTWGGESAQVWDPQFGEQRHPPLAPKSFVRDVQFSPRSSHVATAAWDGTVRVWHLPSGKPAGPPLVHPMACYTLRFAADDDRDLVTESGDRLVRRWDWQSGRFVHFVTDEPSTFGSATSDDGRRLLSALSDGTVRVWDIDTRAPLTPAFPISTDAHTIEIAPGARFAALSGQTDSIEILRLDDLRPPSATDASTALLTAELFAAQRLDRGTLTPLSADEWLDRWHKSRATKRDPDSSNDLTLTWHRQQADHARNAGQVPPELFHLHKLIDAGLGDRRLFSRVADLHAWRRQWRQSADGLANVIELDPSDPRLHLRHGDARFAARDLDRAAESFRTARTLRSETQPWIRGNWWFTPLYEGNLDTTHPPDAQLLHEDTTAPPSTPWQLHADDDPNFAFHARYGGFTNHVVAYAQTFIYSDRDDHPVTLSLGSDDSARVWLNARQIFQHRGFLPDADARVKVTLKRGWNRLTAKIANDTVHHAFHLTILDGHQDP